MRRVEQDLSDIRHLIFNVDEYLAQSDNLILVIQPYKDGPAELRRISVDNLEELALIKSPFYLAVQCFEANATAFTVQARSRYSVLWGGCHTSKFDQQIDVGDKSYVFTATSRVETVFAGEDLTTNGILAIDFSGEYLDVLWNSKDGISSAFRQLIPRESIRMIYPVVLKELEPDAYDEEKTSLFEEHTSAISQDTEDPSLEHDAQTIAYELNYDGVTCLTADAIAAAKVYVALSMLAKNKFAHELNLDSKKQSSAQTSLYDSYDVTTVEDADWKRMSDLVDVGSDVYVAKDGSIDYIQISNDYASSGFNRVRLFIQYLKQTFSQCENKKLIAAACILFTCPGVFMRMKSDNVEGAIEYLASAYRDVQEYI